MVPALTLLRSRILTRVAGSSTAVGMTVVAGCASPIDEPRQLRSDGASETVYDTSGGTEVSAPGMAQAGEEAPDEITGEETFDDIELVLEIGDLSRFVPLRVTVTDAPSLSEVRVTIGAVPRGTPCVLDGCLGDGPPILEWFGFADEDGVVEFHADLSDSMQIDLTYGVKAELVEAPLVTTVVVQADPARPTCQGGTFAEPSVDAAGLADGDVFRVVAALPASGVCDNLFSLGTWDPHDMLVDGLQQFIPAPLEVAATCQDGSLVESCMYLVEIVDPTAVGGGGGGGWGGGGGGGGGWAGRPFLVDGQNRLAGVVARDTWTESIRIDAPWLDPELRNRLAAMYAQDGQHEHASVATFARLTLELMALGAPAALVQQSTQAQLDEIVHAKHCFSIASAIAGSPYSAGGFDMTDAFPANVTPESVLVAAVIEGCIQETISSAHVSVAATRCRLPEIASVLESIAEDETRHAELSWDIVRWLVTEHPELRDVARRAFDAYDLGDEPESDTHASVLADYGQWSDRERHRLSVRVMKAVVLPAARLLLGD